MNLFQRNQLLVIDTSSYSSDNSIINDNNPKSELCHLSRRAEKFVQGGCDIILRFLTPILMKDATGGRMENVF